MSTILFGVAAILATAALALPGVLSVRVALPAERDGDPADGDRAVGRVLMAIGWAAGLVPALAFTFCLLTGVRVSWWVVGMAAALNSGAALVWLRRRGGARLLDLRPALPPLRAAAPVLLAAALVGLLYLLTYDNRSHASESCIYRTAYAAIGQVAPASDLDPGVDLLRENVEDARLGNTAVLAAFLVLYQGLGFRFLFALCGVMLALGGYLIGGWVGGRRGWGWLGLALLPLNPMVLSMPQLDENLLALSFSMALMPVVVAGGRGGWGAAGALFALVLAMRHVMLPATPALLLAAWQSRGRGRALAWLVATLGVTTLPVTLHHSLALGSPLRFESNAQFPVFGYQLAGIDFGYQGLMNWPFADQLVRTPHNPFPMLVLWPLTVADHLGLILFAALVVGAGALWWLSPRKGAFWLLWSWAVVGGLLFQEGWDCKNKMWVLIIVFGAFVAWIVAAGEAVRRQPAWVLPPMLAIALAGWGAARGLGDWEVPADARYVCVEPATCAENPAQLAEDRRLATRLGALPDLRRLGHNGPFLAVAKIRDLFRSLADPGVVRDPLPWGWFPGETPPPGTPVTVRIDLSDAPHGRVAFLGLTDEPADVDLTDGGGPLALRGVRVPWDERKLTLYLDANRELAVAVAFYDGDLPYPACGAETESRAERIRSQRAWALAVLLGEEEDPELQPRARTFDEPVVRVQVPGGALSFAMEKHLGPDRLLLWKAVSHGGGIDVEAPFEPWDN